VSLVHIPSSCWQQTTTLLQNGTCYGQQKIVPVDQYDCCVNDSVLFQDSAMCPKCGEERLQPHSKIARKFQYIPIQPHSRWIFGNKTSKHLQSHKPTNATSNDTDTIMSDLHQSPAWISKYDDNGPFQGDPHRISLALCTDGMNPFSEHSTTYCMWPISLTILNLPCHVRNLTGSTVYWEIFAVKIFSWLSLTARISRTKFFLQ